MFSPIRSSDRAAAAGPQRKMKPSGFLFETDQVTKPKTIRKIRSAIDRCGSISRHGEEYKDITIIISVGVAVTTTIEWRVCWMFQSSLSLSLPLYMRIDKDNRFWWMTLASKFNRRLLFVRPERTSSHFPHSIHHSNSFRYRLDSSLRA